MELNVWSREPWDQYYYNLFEDMVKVMPDDCEMYYIIYCPIRYSFDRLKKITYTKKLVGIMIIEELQFEHEYFQGQLTPAAAHIVELCKLNPYTQFIIFTEIEYFNKEVPEIDNLYIVPIGSGLMFEREKYQTIAPVTEKNFASTQTFVSLNRSLRSSRVTALSYLLGTGISHQGYLSFKPELIKDYDSWLKFCAWPMPDECRSQILSGFEMLKQGLGITQSTLTVDKLYRKQPCNNAENFDQLLRNIYKNTFVEIVTETTYSLPGVLVTEKTQNSMYGYNFPIFIADQGIVKHLRDDLKLDMFDDVVDHSYDDIEDYVLRIVTAIESNRKLLVDSEYSKKCWEYNYDRFTKNIMILRTQVEKFYHIRAWDNLNTALTRFGYV